MLASRAVSSVRLQRWRVEDKLEEKRGKLEKDKAKRIKTLAEEEERHQKQILSINREYDMFAEDMEEKIKELEERIEKEKKKHEARMQKLEEKREKVKPDPVVAVGVAHGCANVAAC